MALDLKNITGYTQFINTKFVDVKPPDEVYDLKKHNILYGSLINLKSVALNKYVVAENNGLLNANRNKATALGKFKVVMVDDASPSSSTAALLRFGDTITLKSDARQKYISASSKGMATATWAQPMGLAKFTVISATGEPAGARIWSNSIIGLLSFHNMYLVAGHPGGSVNAWAASLGVYEKFQIIIAGK